MCSMRSKKRYCLLELIKQERSDKNELLAFWIQFHLQQNNALPSLC